MLKINRYQWWVLFAAWLGWGFDVFEGLLFNIVAPNCVPTLLHLPLGSKDAISATFHWTGVFSSVLLLGWAAGGLLFGQLADRIGRSRTLVLTIALYSVGTAACALAPNLWVLLLLRTIVSLGIGGEWAAGASLVAEVMPESKRIEAGALLYTAAPFGLFLATLANSWIARSHLGSSPDVSWRYLFLVGILPAAVALGVRWKLREPERWRGTVASAPPPKFRELFDERHRALTCSGFLMSTITLITWWGCNAFLPVVSSSLAQRTAGALSLDRTATLGLVESWKTIAILWFTLGGLLGTLFTVPAARFLGRKKMYGLYLSASGLAALAAFALDLPDKTRLAMYFPIGLTVFGVCGSFTFYLPELFPTRLRGTAVGFCYNAGRIVAAAGPFLVGGIASRGSDALASALTCLSVVGLVPLAGLACLPWIVETRGRALSD